MMTQISFLGGCSLCDATGRPVRLATRKSAALLAYLTLSRGREIGREKLAALLWPRSSDTNGRASLRQELAVLRKALAAAGLPKIDSTKQTIRFEIADDLVDALRIARLVKAGTGPALRQAVDLYGGDFLGGLNIPTHPFEDWLWVESQRLKSLVLTAWLQVLDIDIAGSDTEQAIATATGLLALEPTQEQGHRALMRVYRRMGRRAEAMQQFQRCVDILQRELDTDPSPETVELADRIRADQASAVPSGVRTGAVADKEVGTVRTMIVLSASLAGLSGPESRSDPRDLARLQDAFAAHAAQQIVERGGRLTDRSGTGVLACFGYPELSVLDLDHAITAARAIVSRHFDGAKATTLQPRVGIARGEVLIRGPQAEPQRAEVIGTARCIAEDLAGRGEGGEILISADLRTRIGIRHETDEMPVMAEPGRMTGNRGYRLRT